MIRKIGIVFAAWLVAAETSSGGEVYKIDAARSTISFAVRHFFGNATGTFHQFSGTIDLDREHPENSSVIATIQTKSIDTAIQSRDEHLRGETFFNVSKFPEITFKSSEIQQTGADTGDITGAFTMHGVTKPLVLHVKYLGTAGDKGSTRWQVTTPPLKRTAFGLQWTPSVERVSMIGDDVNVTIMIVAARAK
jgi:polyisoprenoid-binding protein YceI